MKIIEIVTTFSYQPLVKEILEQENLKECWVVTGDGKSQLIMQLLVTPERYQSVLDALQRLLMFDSKARIIVLPVEIVLPISTQNKLPTKPITILRETLYQQVESNARVDSHFILLVFLSTIVAAIGLLKDNVAVIIGAMVIAPLLGPNLALALATALGSKQLLWQAVKSNLVGLGGSLLLTILLALFYPVDLNSHELISRTEVGIDSVILALAAGIVAVLSLTSGLSMTLVGVMVAVALLPPVATLGLMIGSGQWQLAIGSSLLLAVNIVCVNLAAKIVFFLKGVKPRIWLDREKAEQSITVFIVIWLIYLSILVTIIYLR
jgi:uncharacterized hydrophobic protein (TIGR00341 family)